MCIHMWVLPDAVGFLSFVCVIFFLSLSNLSFLLFCLKIFLLKIYFGGRKHLTCVKEIFFCVCCVVFSTKEIPTLLQRHTKRVGHYNERVPHQTIQHTHTHPPTHTHTHREKSHEGKKKTNGRKRVMYLHALQRRKDCHERCKERHRNRRCGSALSASCPRRLGNERTACSFRKIVNFPVTINDNLSK